jgi:membrane protein implicated in regulation of membrane protease activity
MMAWMWIIAAGVLLGIEIMTADLLFASLAVSALAAGLAGGLGANMVVQIVVFAITAAITIGMLRPVALRHLHKPPLNAATGIDALVGASAMTLEKVDSIAGTVKLSGETWSARTENGEVPAGTKVSVLRIDGAIAIVKSEDD